MMRKFNGKSKRLIICHEIFAPQLYSLILIFFRLVTVLVAKSQTYDKINSYSKYMATYLVIMAHFYARHDDDQRHVPGLFCYGSSDAGEPSSQFRQKKQKLMLP
jgi:hypothetical protein